MSSNYILLQVVRNDNKDIGKKIKRIEMNKRKVSVSADQNKPNAWIASSTDRGRKSIKTGNKIYLDDDQEFIIELYNPLSESILSDIRVNGKSVSKNGLVLRPGERFYLDCFIDDKKKFIFKTYEVEDNSESKTAIAKNGTVEVFFYKEDVINFENWRDRYYPIIRHYYPIWYPYYPTPYYPTPYWYGNGNSTITMGSSNNLTSNTVYNSSSLNSGDFTISTTNAGYTSNSNTSLNSASYTSNSIETGRIEKGNSSNQKFSEIDMEFEKNHISNVLYQLLPNSQKPIETEDIKKKFCEDCGNKLKGTERFCPNCGEQL